MSSNLCWEPAYRERQTLPYEIKRVLQNKYGGTIEHRNMNEANLDYLRGLSDGGVQGAAALIAAIEKHGTVTLTELF